MRALQVITLYKLFGVTESHKSERNLTMRIYLKMVSILDYNYRVYK